MAASRYERALVLKSDYPEAWNDLGVVEFRRGEYSRARKCFEKAVALSPEYAEAWLNLADSYSELGHGAGDGATPSRKARPRREERGRGVALDPSADCACPLLRRGSTLYLCSRPPEWGPRHAAPYGGRTKFRERA